MLVCERTSGINVTGGFKHNIWYLSPRWPCACMCVCVLSDADLFAGTRNPRQAVTVPQGELDFNVDALCSFSADVARPQPVVLVGLHDVAHLVGPHRGVPLIHHTDLLPLKNRGRERGKKAKWAY